MRDESEKEVIHRLEAFSDIVIGFSLAQLGLSLTMPPHIRDLFFQGHGLSTLGTFVMTFSLVCSLWWLHHKIFRHLFAPTAANIALNFAALGGVLFYVYAMQVILHVGFRDPYALPLYVGCYAYIIVLFAIIAWTGLLARGEQMNQELRQTSKDLTIRLTIIALAFTTMTVVVLVAGASENILPLVLLLLVLPLTVQRIIIRRRKRALVR